MSDRKNYMRNYYKNRKVDLRNKSLIRSHKLKLLKAPNLKKALNDLLVNNHRRRHIIKNKIDYRQITIYFD